MTTGFNPHPTRRLGAMLPENHRRRGGEPMFQSSPNPKVGCHFGFYVVPAKKDRCVSILTQPEGWVPFERKEGSQ